MTPVDRSSSEPATDEHSGITTSGTTSLAIFLSHSSKCWFHWVLGTLPRWSRRNLHRWSKKSSLFQIKSRRAGGPQWSTPVLHKWDTKTLSRSPRFRQNRKSIEWKPRSLESAKAISARTELYSSVCCGLALCGLLAFSFSHPFVGSLIPGEVRE